jgi:hypothetical protein
VGSLASRNLGSLGAKEPQGTHDFKETRVFKSPGSRVRSSWAPNSQGPLRAQGAKRAKKLLGHVITNITLTYGRSKIILSDNLYRMEQCTLENVNNCLNTTFTLT